MSRTFDAQSLVTLPRLDAAGGTALAAEIASAAKGRDLPEVISDALAAVKRTGATLQKAVGLRGQPDAVDPARARDADIQEDAAWSALFHFLTAWAALPESFPQAKDARAAFQILFYEGLKFTQLVYKLEWGEAEARLTRIAKDGTAEAIGKLGGDPFLQNLKRAHTEYGKALGVTAQKPAVPAPPAIREAFDAFAAAVRSYVLVVAGQVREKDNKSAELAAALLEPITRWESKAVHHGPQAPTTGAPAASDTPEK